MKHNFKMKKLKKKNFIFFSETFMCLDFSGEH